ncbi:FAD-dependent oxidoreductase [Rhodococcus sp. BP-252]|uniref:flavin monoamine oxidase family protein n=1 Tax=unclassified Rhodococcus (in: high G+C Gram-positive bacteria) TaxID=192944 RepID=UPI001C9AC3FA|nr:MULTISPECIES: NAD(P)/FAD-dependent oxidoreductase [unclassified Rhodococcus (in: high G+C Gram-positive bacteria)]MBY6414666.1 FAD-dependent oxidoreductase [Rhodococcus sp. BP-320]MBY6419491.1 FAD-dependent oxidoreductase [Rhodococcus sp. BP-321]MBY6424497.1 FAD-dependent oxidoreductase [Rhodococcus sp. BP-324]MBY6429502.1 FAD-dependent oxidoreductase [Rhodococcus sp. BP-323]MBY6434507.1 FAD-dependent oxidoreductase [Rhodococcus sp. BP-322]
MTAIDYDAVIVGGGFAGVTAARELTQRGASVLLLEARDRLGGRTWTRPSDLGLNLEIGGTWVHWTQPHIWAEIARYGLPLVSSPVPERGLWKVHDEIRTGPAERLFELLDAGMSQTIYRAAELLPHPFKFAPVSDELRALDHISIANKISELDLDDEQRALVEGMWGLNFSGYPANGAYTQALRWAALTAGNWTLLFEACATYKLQDGTKSLLDAIAAQSTADIRLNSPVSRIDHAGDQVKVTLTDGSAVTVREVIVTLPLNVLGAIDFAPELPRDIASIAAEGQASTGVKVWARIKGDIGRVAALGPTSCPLNFFQYEYSVDGDSLIVAFGADNTRIDVTDRKAVQNALRLWIPEIEVLSVDGHDWVADPLSGQTWPMLRPNQLEGVRAAADSAFGHVHLAGSDYAEGWAGFIDGAIESAMKVSNRVLQALA